MKEALQEVAKEVYSKCFHDSVGCISLKIIKERIENKFKVMKERNKRMGKKNMAVVGKFKYQMEKMYELLQVFL